MKFGLADDIKFKFIDTVLRKEFQQKWPNAKYVDIDGIRMDTKDEMAIVRASQNGPYITVKFEGKTQEQYNAVKEALREILKRHSEINWSKGVNIHTLD